MFYFLVVATPSEPDISQFTDNVSGILHWFLTSFTKLTSWILADPIVATVASIFLVGVVVAILFRILQSC